MKLSIVIPVYNERNTLQTVIDAVKSVQMPNGINDFEIILVDDYSTDGTRQYIEELQDSVIVKCFHPENAGKGRALATGFAVVCQIC